MDIVGYVQAVKVVQVTVLLKDLRKTLGLRTQWIKTKSLKYIQ
mgnify:FL=1